MIHTLATRFTFRTRRRATDAIREAVRMELDMREFEAQLREVERVSKMSEARLQQLAAKAREMGGEP
ncbi:MAG: hypothetical protein GTN69_03470 [Armatimonadetes bacterium]|nr:hypothetical protein [Armatimonadota bacterium]